MKVFDIVGFSGKTVRRETYSNNKDISNGRMSLSGRIFRKSVRSKNKSVGSEKFGKYPSAKQNPSELSNSSFEFRFRVSASLVFMCWPFGSVLAGCTGSSGQFGPYILALRANFVRMYWPFGPVWSLRTGPSGQFSLYVLALRIY